MTCILFCIFLFSRAKGGILTNYLFQFARILAFCFLGEVLHAVLPLPVPASVYGLVLLLAALTTGFVKLEQVKETGTYLTGIFPLLFVPAAAGIMELWAELGQLLLAGEPIGLMPDDGDAKINMELRKNNHPFKSFSWGAN